MKHHYLQTHEVDERYTAENLGVELQAALKELGLEGKVYPMIAQHTMLLT